jgi:replicative DNA helicase
LLAWADSDVFWDTVVSITYEGLEQVYDLTVPDLHNFVANDICLHNTAFGLGLAAYAAFSEKKPTLFFSLEMGYLELIQRMLAFEADVNGQVLKGKRKLTEDEQARVNAANKRFMESPLFIYDNPNVTLPTIRSMCRQVKARTGELGLVVIDYIQLIQGASKSENRQQEVSEISRGLKILARELKTPVVALAQLSRNLESRVDKRPMLADLRESGSLEQDADVVMFLYRDVMYNPASEDKHIGEVIVAKHRNGANGTVRLVFLPEQSAFCDTKLPGGEEEAAEGAAQEKGSAVGHHSDGAAGNDVVPALAGHSSLDDTEEPF